MLRLNRPGGLKHGPRCVICRNIVDSWKLVGTVPASTLEEAHELALLLKGPRDQRRWRPATRKQQTIAKIGLQWLETSENKIALVPAPDPRHSMHKIRVVEQTNPDWYRDLAADYGFSDRPGRGRKCKQSWPPLRQQVLAALRRLSSGWFDPIARDALLLELIEESLERQGWRYAESGGQKEDVDVPF